MLAGAKTREGEFGICDFSFLTLHLLILVGVARFEVIIVVVLHRIIASFFLGRDFGEVDLLAARATAALDDVVCGDGLEVVVAAFFVLIDLYVRMS